MTSEGYLGERKSEQYWRVEFAAASTGFVLRAFSRGVGSSYHLGVYNLQVKLVLLYFTDREKVWSGGVRIGSDQL